MEHLAGHHARKRFGQNFLVDEHWIGKLAEAIDAREDEHIVEIGPGQAALTRRLIATAQHIQAVEIDRDLASWLRETFPADSLTLIEADALKLNWAELAEKNAPLRIVGNLPYNISSPLLFALIEAAGNVKDQHFMLQREVVDRMVAHEGSKTYGRLSVMLQWRYRMTKLFDVPAGAFRPVPDVVSSFVRMTPKPANEVPNVDYAHFGKVVFQAFSQRRKTLRNALASMLTEAEIRECDIEPSSRAEALPVEAFVRLTTRIEQKGGILS